MSHPLRLRRGASAVEFALVLPIITAMVMGLLDYGWFFSQQSQSVGALTAALRASSNITPGIGSRRGTCDDCVAMAKTHAVLGLENLGITMDRDDIQPQIERIEGTCALTLSVDVPHQPLLDMVPMPETYHVDAIWMLLNVNDC